ncbi:MAG TPA: cytochrome c-type biogenesis protein [Xanthomonadaceae bacterium]|jgi:cytochrome c-type biogenesis protein CcmH|nr:cytochrome c-type biogenesis protein [Xanthomonadaceae bacterium]
MKRIFLAIVLLLVSSTALALATKSPATQPEVYRNPAEETRFHILTTSLRCVMCQNESLADSQAPIAHDLRREILELMRQGKSDAQIREFLVARYGEFVLYQPRVEPATWLLWFGPLLLFVSGGGTVAWIVRRRALRARTTAVAQPTTTDPSDVESSEEW